MNLISLNCSGESLEKAIVLCHTSFMKNWRFYRQFKTIYVFYCDNLPKKNKGLKGMSGTVGSYVNGATCSDLLNSAQSYILKSPDKIIDILKNREYITGRTYFKLKNSSSRKDKVISNIPMNFVFDTYHNTLLDKFRNYCPKVEFVRIEFHDILDYYIKHSFYIDGHSRIYGLQADGNIATFELGCVSRERKIIMGKQIKRSICLSPNVYSFLKAIDLWIKYHNIDVLIGYRPLTRFQRRSYDLSIIELSKKNKMIIEPRNTLFSSMLDELPYNLTVEERSNIGIIQGFNRFITKIDMKQSNVTNNVDTEY